MKVYGLLAAAVFVASIVAANYLTTRYGFVPVGFGLSTTAGTLTAGAALVVRDATQDLLGRLGVLVVIVIGAAVSFAISDPAISLASALAVLFSESANFAIYTPLRSRARYGDRRWSAAVVTADLTGAVVDTAAFLGVAFGWSAVQPALAGQLVGKAWAALLYLLIGWSVRRAVSRESVYAEGA